MPRRLRHKLQGTVFHVVNRAVRRATIFHGSFDYVAFLSVVRRGLSRSNVKVIAYCVMPNHWHFIVTYERVADLSRLLHWITRTDEANKVRCGQKHIDAIGVPFAVAVTADEV